MNECNHKWDEKTCMFCKLARERDTARAEVERLREALRQVLSEYDDNDEGPTMRTMMLARAALAGSPVETRTETPERIARRIESLLSTPCATPDFLEGVRRAAQRVRAGHLTTVVDAVSEPVETRRPSASLALHDRALAERVREHIAIAVCAELASSHDEDEACAVRDIVRALDLDPMLEEP